VSYILVKIVRCWSALCKTASVEINTVRVHGNISAYSATCVNQQALFKLFVVVN